MPTYTCPTCRASIYVKDHQEAPFQPFCSERCKLIDLGKWLNEEYRIEAPLNINELDNSPEGHSQEKP